MASFTLRRLSDGLTYTFSSAGTFNGRPLFRRADNRDMTIRWEPDFGWCARLPESGALADRVWDLLPAQQPDVPPEGIWVSRKGDKSHVYKLEWA